MVSITKTFNLYSYDELSQSAKNRALDSWYCTEWWEQYEYLETLKEIEETFGINVKICREQAGYVSYYVTMDYEYSTDVDGSLRVAKWIINNWYNNIVKGKYYLTNYKPGKEQKHRYSRVIKEHNNCPICGTWCESGFIKVLDDIATYKQSYNTLIDAIEAALDAFFKDYRQDYEYYYSEDSFIEHCNENDIRFFENGTIY